MSALLTAAAAAGPPLAAGWSVHTLWMRRRIAAAQRDPLTGLLRREAFERQARRLLGERPSAVVVIDLNGFKLLNDTAGHAAGDAALRAVGERLTGWAQAAGGTAGRLGGDEFAALAPCDSRAFLPEGLELLHSALCEPVPYDVLLLPMGAAVGAVWHDGRTAADLSALLRRADEAMYATKRTGAGPLIADHPAPALRTVNGRRDGRPGTHLYKHHDAPEGGMS